MLNKSNTNKILSVIFSYPTTKFTIRELARKTGISAPTAMIIVRTLKKEGIVKELRVATASQVSANLESEVYRRKKLVYNLEEIFLSNLIEYLSETYKDPNAIILFGSYSKGYDIEKSDIDIAVITEEKRKLDLDVFEKKLARKISIHEITLDKISEEFKNNLCNGIVLKGAL
ncbi:nucleotidyltransferase domain-containing protein [Candidatus Woesearchaeota archaeon]|nr:nucleotidyltransferase domain-containing protein [Candidatus Woesearchaeota archaeon]